MEELEGNEFRSSESVVTKTDVLTCVDGSCEGEAPASRLSSSSPSFWVLLRSTPPLMSDPLGNPCCCRLKLIRRSVSFFTTVVCNGFVVVNTVAVTSEEDDGDESLRSPSKYAPPPEV
mmetsp:Transcript_9358/g.31289  ORF Transcript_9358/g.31289 Transcript_9358/m.31289 type:complete len:118 (+) Transcript_9358:317-670(+)